MVDSNTDYARGEKGHFAKGNRGGPGNAITRKSYKIRNELLSQMIEHNAPRAMLYHLLKIMSNEMERTADRLKAIELLARIIEPREAETLIVLSDAVDSLGGIEALKNGGGDIDLTAIIRGGLPSPSEN